MNICVFSSSQEGLANEYYETAYEVGRLIAKDGHTLVFGGYQKGIMGAVARGCAEHGGKVISVIPKVFNGMRSNFTEGAEVIITNTMSERKAKMAELSDVFFSLPGGVGTFDELFEVITQNDVGESNKPVAILMQGETQQMLGKLFATAVREGFISQRTVDGIGFFGTAEELFKHLKYA